MHKLLALSSLFFITFFSLPAQKMVYDSVLIEFGYIKDLRINAFVDTIIDKRNTKTASIAVYEKYKYIFIPVDKYVMLHKPLPSAIKELFLPQGDTLKNYIIEIKQFDVATRKRDLLTTNYLCNAALEIYSLENHNKKYEGTFLYENEIAQTRKTEAGYEAVLDDWKLKFVEDMQNYIKCTDSCHIYNFRREVNAYKKNMLLNSELYLGLDSWLLDGEVVFSRPESQKKFYREASGLRYRKEKKYQSFETSLKNKQTFNRLSENLLFAMKFKTFLGLNRWNSDEYKNHGIEDIFLLDISLSQQLIYNRFYKKGITMGIGIMENVTYIYSEDFKFNPYVMLQLGIKL